MHLAMGYRLVAEKGMRNEGLPPCLQIFNVSVGVASVRAQDRGEVIS